MPSSQLLIGDLIRRNAATVPHRVAAWMDGRAILHRELDAGSNRLARALRELGVGHGDRVVTWADTALEILPIFAALAKLGAVFAPLNARLGADEAQPIVEMARAKMLISDAPHAADAATVRSRAGIDLLGGFGGCEGMTLDLVTDAQDLPFSDEVIDEPALRETDPHVIFFTSGSTGLPKGVVLSHRSNHLRSYQGVFLDDYERSVCMFPAFHMAAFTLALSAWQTQGEIAFVREATADEIMTAVDRRRANRLYCIPAVWNRILASDLSGYDTSALRHIDTGTSATPIELLRALEQQFPQSVLRVYYGSTEAGAGTSLADVDVLRKPGSVGRPSPGVDLRISEAGEICLRTHYLMDGYFDDPEATVEALEDGWYHTGDLGVCDDEGYLSIVGRMKEIIRTGGEAVAPAEVEEVLSRHPAVAEVAVVGLPDPEWGEVVCAVVVARAGATPMLEDLQQHCEGELAGFKKPRRLECVERLPRTAATGQVQRILLVEEIHARSS